MTWASGCAAGRLELRREPRVDARTQERARLRVLLVVDVPVLVHPADEVAARVRHDDLDLHAGARELVGDELAQLGEIGRASCRERVSTIV